MPFLGKFFNQNSDDFGITNIDLIYAVFGKIFFIKILTILGKFLIKNLTIFGINIDLIFAVFGKVRV